MKCNKHINFHGELCPVCLMEERDALVRMLIKAKSAVEWMADATDSDPEDRELLAEVNNAIDKATRLASKEE